jgi:hypothetical protein
MGHFVTGIVARMEVLQAFATRHSLHRPVNLEQGLALLPLRDDDLDSFLLAPLTGHRDEFNYLSDQLLRELEAGSAEGDLMYFETEYFGGVGSQGAVVLRNEQVVFGPKAAEHGAINEALAVLGVPATSTRDRFESIGLNRHRHTEDWLDPGA